MFKIINSITEAIYISLQAEFGDGYKICREEKGQGAEVPAFLIRCQRSTGSQFQGKRYFRQNCFCIRYFPGESGKENEECQTVAERLFTCLRWLPVGAGQVMGTNMQCEMADGVLQFFVNYDRFVREDSAPVPKMEEISEEVSVKGQVKHADKEKSVNGTFGEHREG